MYEDGGDGDDDDAVVDALDADRMAVDDLKAVKEMLPLFRPYTSTDAVLLLCNWMRRDKSEQYP